MFKISYRDLRDNATLSAMQKLANCTAFRDIKVGYNVMRMSKAMEAALKKSQEEWVKMADNFVEKDETGRYRFEKNSPVWKPGVDPKDGEKAIEEFLAKETIVERHKIKLEDLQPANLTPNELAAIEPIYTALESVQ